MPVSPLDIFRARRYAHNHDVEKGVNTGLVISMPGESRTVLDLMKARTFFRDKYGVDPERFAQLFGYSEPTYSGHEVLSFDEDPCVTPDTPSGVVELPVWHLTSQKLDGPNFTASWFCDGSLEGGRRVRELTGSLEDCRVRAFFEILRATPALNVQAFSSGPIVRMNFPGKSWEYCYVTFGEGGEMMVRGNTPAEITGCRLVKLPENDPRLRNVTDLRIAGVLAERIIVES